jgi:hypothetical protein
MPGTQLVTGLGGAIGSQYLLPTHQLIFVEYDLGQVSAIDLMTSAYTVLGGEFGLLEDVVVASDGNTAYLTQRTGEIFRISLSDSPDLYEGSTVLVAGLSAPHQMALDEAHSALYVVEFADPGRLVRIDLATSAVTEVFTALHNAIGLLLAADGQYAYVTEQTPAGLGTLSRLDLITSSRQLLYTSSTAPLFMMTWSDPGQNSILVTERDPANTVWSIDLNTAPPEAHAIVTGAPTRPSSVGVVTADHIVVCCDQEIDDYQLTGDVYTPGGPLLLGIGFVPEDKIDTDGLANTTGDPSYFFQVADCPFGGSLPLMVNHPRAVGLGAAFYKLFIDSVEQRTAFSDYLWDTSSNEFKITSVGPDTNGFYTLHQPGEVWYNPFLGGFINTSGLAEDALHALSVQIYQFADDLTQIDTSGETTVVSPRIVNAGPIATINGIFHELPDSTLQQVQVCDIVTTESDTFYFSVTAYHPDIDGAGQGWLRSWGLAAYWGDDKGAMIAGNSYPGTPSKRWNDPNTPLLTAPPTPADPLVPAGGWPCSVAGDPTSRNCAHTFWLDVYDRVINGWTFLHGSSYHQSITIMLGP